MPTLPDEDRAGSATVYRTPLSARKFDRGNLENRFDQRIDLAEVELSSTLAGRRYVRSSSNL